MARIWNCFGFPKLELENLSFSSIRKIKSDNTACRNFGLPAAAHPHSCAQPRAQLVEACALQKLETSWGLAACAWRGFGTSSGSQNRNLEIIFFSNICKFKSENTACSNFGCGRGASTQLRPTARATAWGMRVAGTWSPLGIPKIGT
mgnify:CR=1 FL=1